jgi:phosphonopyruvate decarboxylase
MIEPAACFELLRDNGVEFFAGVPDSLLSSFCAYVEDHSQVNSHVITANEGNAVAAAIGHHMATGTTSCVYMQNSGLGNTVNPLTSLADKAVYSVPMLLVIGWRGEPGISDEPQHVKQGVITAKQLDLLGIPYQVLDKSSDLKTVFRTLFDDLTRSNAPVALLVKKGAFASYKSIRQHQQLSEFGREDALGEILKLSKPSDNFISTTGKTSRELFELRLSRGETPADFLTVGGMGHTSSIALGVAIGNPNRRVICIDGDGSALMHLGALPIIGSVAPANLVHILLNNAAHESVGGQPTVAGEIDLGKIALASNYKSYQCASTAEELQAAWAALSDDAGPAMIEVRISAGSRSDLGRPTATPVENKLAFMAALNG